MGKLITCFRCRGLKKVFKIGGAYSLNDCGGQKVDCPLCLGVGEIEPLSAANDEIKEKVKDSKKNNSAIKNAVKATAEKIAEDIGKDIVNATDTLKVL